MNAGVACGGVKSLPATVSVSSGSSLIHVFTEDLPWSLPVPQSSGQCPPDITPASVFVSDHPVHLLGIHVSFSPSFRFHFCLYIYLNLSHKLNLVYLLLVNKTYRCRFYSIWASFLLILSHVICVITCSSFIS